MRVQVAAVGAGYFSQFQFRGWQAIAEVELLAVSDLNEQRARAAAASHGFRRAYCEVEEMLDVEGPALLDVVTPPATHSTIVSAALERGVPVICQKPFCLSLLEAEALTRAAEAAGVPLIVHENFRWRPWYREIKRLIDCGQLGRLHAIAFRFRPGDGQGANAYIDRQPYFREMPQFLIRETAVHFIDTFRFLVGEVVAVTARLRRINPAITGEDAGYVIFEFAGGATGLFDGNRLNDHPGSDSRLTMGEMWLEGEAGVLRLDGDSRLWWKPHQEPEEEHAYDRGRTPAVVAACEQLQRHVVQHLATGAPAENTARAYLRNLEIQEAIYQSSGEGRRIDIPEARV